MEEKVQDSKQENPLTAMFSKGFCSDAAPLALLSEMHIPTATAKFFPFLFPFF